MMKVYINSEVIPLIGELMNATVERGGVFLYELKIDRYEYGHDFIIIERLFEYANESEKQDDSVIGRLTGEQRSEVLDCVPEFDIGMFHNHPSGSCELSEQDKESLKKGQSYLADFKLLLITKNELRVFE